LGQLADVLEKRRPEVTTGLVVSVEQQEAAALSQASRQLSARSTFRRKTRMLEGGMHAGIE
jgi:hypothetical protein